MRNREEVNEMLTQLDNELGNLEGSEVDQKYLDKIDEMVTHLEDFRDHQMLPPEGTDARNWIDEKSSFLDTFKD